MARLSEAGDWRWAVQGDAVAHQNLASLNDMAADGLGHLYVTGVYTSTGMHIGATALPNLSLQAPQPNPLPPTPYTNNYYEDVFVARLDAATGTWGWAVRNGGPYIEYANLIRADAQGRVYVKGSFDAPSLTGSGPDFAQLDGATGKWRTFQKLAPAGVWDMALDGQNRVHLAGYFYTPTVQFGTTTLPQNGPGRGTGYLARSGAGPLATTTAGPPRPRLAGVA